MNRGTEQLSNLPKVTELGSNKTRWSDSRAYSPHCYFQDMNFIQIIFDIERLICFFVVVVVFINLFYLFIFGCVGSSLLLCRLSLVVASRGYSSLRRLGFSLWWLLLLRSTRTDLF